MMMLGTTFTLNFAPHTVMKWPVNQLSQPSYKRIKPINLIKVSVQLNLAES
jgi:hypothetical protein